MLHLCTDLWFNFLGGWQALLDEFAPRFYGELDYVNECANGLKFEKIMENITQVPKP